MAELTLDIKDVKGLIRRRASLNSKGAIIYTRLHSRKLFAH